MAKKKTTHKTAKKEDYSTVFGVFTYLIFLVGLIWYLVDDEIKKNKFAKFHFKQSLVLIIAYIICLAGANILFFIPFLRSAVGIVGFVLAIIGVVNVVNKEQKELPVIGTFAEKFKF